MTGVSKPDDPACCMTLLFYNLHEPAGALVGPVMHTEKTEKPVICCSGD
jgi:hypothetical protein